MKVNIENLKNILHSAVEGELIARDLECLDKDKIVISVTKGPKVLAKVIKVVPIRKTRITKTQVTQIKTIKKVVKVNTDVTYVLALLDDLETATQNLDYKHLTDEAVSAIKDGVEAINKNTTLLLEFKGESNV